MPFAELWNVADPADAEGVSLGASRIRELKRSLAERLLTRIFDWPTPTEPVTNAAVADSVATTFFNVVADGSKLYRVFAMTNGQSSVHQAFCYISVSSTGATLWGLATPGGSNVTITLVGLAIKITHTAGANRSITATLSRIS